ncbi:MAG: HAD-IIB family hydrolase, partial [Bacillota bacterium]
MDYKLIAIDLDDTLLETDYHISSRAQEAIDQAQEQGVKVVIATGRMHASALPYAKQLGLTGPMITYNGALIKEVDSEEIIAHKPVSLELTTEIVDYVEENDLHVNLYCDDILYVNKFGPEAEYYEDLAGVKAVLIKEDLADFVDFPSTKLIIIDNDEEKVQDILADMKEKFGEQLNISLSKSRFVEIMNPEVSKGQ